MYVYYKRENIQIWGSDIEMGNFNVGLFILWKAHYGWPFRLKCRLFSGVPQSDYQLKSRPMSGKQYKTKWNQLS